MTILLTGGAGFIGHHLARHFLSKGRKVIVVDNLSTGLRSNLADFHKNPNFTFVEGDVRQRDLIEPLVAKCEVVYNLAASVGVQKIFRDPIECIENNTEIGSLILKLCSKYRRRLFMFSTSEIYGKTDQLPFVESSNVTLGPSDKLRWSYACSKVLDDYLARAYFEKHQLQVTTVRLFNTIGANQLGQYGMVVPRLMSQALDSSPLTIYGDGLQTRCFTDVRDVVRALDLLIDNARSVGELINIGTSDEISIRDLALRIRDLTKSDSEIQNISYQQAYGDGFEDMKRRVASTAKLKLICGFEFEFTLNESLKWIHEDLLQKRLLTNQDSAIHAV